MARINVCIATYNRNDHLYLTLASLAGMDWASLAEHNIQICVADNNPDGKARAVYERAKNAFPVLELVYWHEARPGVVHVRNRALEASKDADFVAFIDDDQLAEPQWLSALLACQKQTGSAVCYGPIHADYPPGTPQWVLEGDFQSTYYKVTETTHLPGSVGNSLIDMAALARTGLTFDPVTSLTGGEDTLLYTLLHRRGEILAHSADATVKETVPTARTGLAWQTQRWRREGGTDAFVKYYDASGAMRICGTLLDASARITIGGLMVGLATLVSGGRMHVRIARRLFTLHRGLGMLSMALGQTTAEYGRSGSTA